MISFLGICICVCVYTLTMLYLGASITAGLLIIHCVVVPLIFKYSKTFRRTIVFVNFVQWPYYVDFEEPASSGMLGARNLSIEYHSKVDDCKIKIGIWHILPKNTYEKLKEMFDGTTDKETLNKIMDEELATSGKPVMLYCHGNANSRAATHRLELYKFFQKMDYHTISFDYRGYGDSTNITPSEDGVVEDALAVYEWLHESLARVGAGAGAGGAPPPLFVWGHSLGTAISAHLLGNLEELCSRRLGRESPLPLPKGLILEAPFNNLVDEVAHYPLQILATWLPYHDCAFLEPFRRCPEHEFRSDEHLARASRLPLLVLHARDDQVVPYAVGRKLYNYLVKARSESGGEPVKFHSFEKKLDLGHKWICHAENLPEIVDDFVKSSR